MESKVRLGFSACSFSVHSDATPFSKGFEEEQAGGSGSPKFPRIAHRFHKISVFVQGLRDTARHLLKFFVTVAGTELPDSCPEETQALSLVSTSWVV
jgi:hypothetical protein